MNRRILGTLFLVLFVVMLGFSILFPVEPYYIRTFGATSRTMGWLLTVYSLAQFLCSPLWGRVSDRFGRKPVLLLGTAGYAVGMTAFGLAGSIPMLFIARGITGVLSAATLPTAMAMIADTTSEDQRAKGMGILGAAFGLGAIFGPFFGGLLGAVSIQLPYFVAAGISLALLVVVGAVLPETLPRSDESRRASRSQRRWDAFTAGTAPLYLLAGLVTFSLAGLETAFPFLAADRFGLTARTVGYVYAVMGIVGAAVQGGIVGRVKELLGEEKMIVTGLLVSAIGLAGIAASSSTWAATVAISVFAAGNGLIRPANTSLISKRAEVGHGFAIGLMDAMNSLGRVLGPLVAGALYLVRSALPFALGATLNTVGLIGFLLFVGRAGAGPSSGEASP